MKKGMITVAVIVLAAITASPATAAHREWQGGYGSEPGNVADIAGVPGLNLSPQQTERINALREAHRRDIKPLQEQLMGKGRLLRDLWLAKTPDRERILALQREVHDLRGRLLERLAAYRLEVLQMLTPDQQAKVQTFEAERHMGRMGAAGMNRGHFPGWREGGRPPMADPQGKSVRVLHQKRAVWARSGWVKPSVLRIVKETASDTEKTLQATINPPRRCAPRTAPGRDDPAERVVNRIEHQRCIRFATPRLPSPSFVTSFFAPQDFTSRSNATGFFAA